MGDRRELSQVILRREWSTATTTATISELTSTSVRTFSCCSTFADGLTILAWRSSELRLTSRMQPTKCNDDDFGKRFSLHIGKHHIGVVSMATAL
jgi:hypothetical protein